MTGDSFQYDQYDQALQKRLEVLGLDGAEQICLDDDMGPVSISQDPLFYSEAVDDDDVQPIDRWHRFYWIAPDGAEIVAIAHGFGVARSKVETAFGRMGLRALNFQPDSTVRVK